LLYTALSCDDCSTVCVFGISSDFSYFVDHFSKLRFDHRLQLCFRSQSCSDGDSSPRYSASQPLPRRRRGNRRRGNSLTLYHAAVTNAQLHRRRSNNAHCSWDDKSPPIISAADPSLYADIPELRANTVDEPLDILRDSLHAKNIEGTSAPPAAYADGLDGLRAAKSIDDSIDILLSGSDCAVVPVSSIDSGRSSCEPNLLSPPCDDSATCQLSPSSVNLTTSAQSVPTLSTSSSFNDLRPNCFSDDGPSPFSLSSDINTHPLNGPLSGTTRVSRYQKGKTSLDFAEARDSERQWHQLDHMQVCTSLQTDNYASTTPLRFLQARCPSVSISLSSSTKC